VSQASTGNI